MKLFTSKKQKIGEIGENIASRFLRKSGYSILDRNYTKKYGEIDIITIYENMYHFIEVKTITCTIDSNTVIHETLIRPEENMHPGKIKRLFNTIQAYWYEKQLSENVLWQLDLVCVYLDQKNKKARIKLIENIII